MKQFLSLIAFLIISAVNVVASPVKVYVLDIDDEINSTTWLHTRNGISQAQELGSDLLLVKLNTYGGEVVYADSIRSALIHTPIPTVAFIDNNAASAGALITLACDTVYMRPDATMGAVTVVNGLDGQAMPDKYQSYMRAMMRATAERHGKVLDSDSVWQWRRDPLIAEAMVDSRVQVPGLIDSTRVLTFTPDEAIRWRYADGKAESISDVLGQLGVDDYHISRYKAGWETSLLGWLTSPGIQAILIMIIMASIYFELQSPGMGFPTVAGTTAAILYFMPLCMTGVVSTWVVIAFVIGIILILLEIFVVPGFGVTGIAGGVIAVGALFVGLLENFSTPELGIMDISVIGKACITLLISIVLTVALVWYLTSHYAPAFVRHNSELTKVQNVEDGYIGVDMTVHTHVGAEGVAATDLRPSGKINIDGKEYDAVSERGFIEAGTSVEVVRHANAQLYVVPRK